MKRFVLLASLIFSGSVFANDYQPLFDSCLALKNNTQSNEALSCRYFIKGFMAASSLTGVPLESSIDKNNSEFFKRAYDSRLGTTSLDQRQADCDVPKNQELIINEVSSSMPEKLNNLGELKLIIINALKKNQSCGPKKK